MSKNSKKVSKIQLYQGFLGAFLSRKLGVIAKNLLIGIFSNWINYRGDSFELRDKKNGNRIPDHLNKILKNAFLDDDKPIFTTLTYAKGHVTYEFSKEAIAYFKWAKESHALKKSGKIKRAEKYTVVDVGQYQSLRSKHSQTIYIKALCWTDTYKLVIGKKEMTALFGKRKNKDMRRDVLLPAIEKINQKTTLNIDEWDLHRFGRLAIDFTPVVHKSPKKVKIDSQDEDKRIAVNVLVSEYNQSIPFAVKSYDVLGFDFLDSFVRMIDHKKRHRGFYSLDGYVYTVLSRQIARKQYEDKVLERMAS